MSKKSRYLLLLAGFMFFLIFAPLAVLYVTGYKYDNESKSFVRTGILAVRANPSSVSVSLNGELKRKNDGNIKFLDPGEYAITLAKDGYQSWTKRLLIQANQVTWANPSPADIFLFKNNLVPESISEQTTDFVITSGSILYISQNKLILSPIGNLSHIDNYALNKPANTIIASPKEDIFLLTDKTASSTAMVFNIRDRQITDISGLFSGDFNLEFSDDGTLYALEDKTIYKINLSPPGKTVIATGVANFAAATDNIYYLKSTTSLGSLMVLSPGSNQPQTLIAEVPSFTKARIFVNFQKQILLLLDNTLYRVSDTLLPVAANVTSVKFDQPTSNFLVLHDGQLDFYNYYSQNLTFITRTSQVLSNFDFRPDLGYAFFFLDKTITALELDTRNHQNQYSLYAAQNPQKFTLDTNGKILFILDGEKLLAETVR